MRDAGLRMPAAVRRNAAGSRMSRLPRVLFFDLDGTLVDSEAGIVNGIRQAFDALGLAQLDQAALREWIGPPLRDSFQAVLADPARVEQALSLYRARYDAQGWRELTVFAGAPEAVHALHAAGHRLAVVTSKNERAARRILQGLAFGACFEQVVGASDDGTRRFKADLIAEALRRMQVAAARCVMIGDRRMDMEGAAAHGMAGIGVLWGFGDADELRAAGASVLVEDFDALQRAVAVY